MSESYAQKIPADSIILKLIYGSYDLGGKSFTRKHKADEPVHEYYKDITYSVKLKENINLDSQNVLFIVCQAPVFYQHYHTFFLIDYYFFKQEKGKWELSSSIKGKFENALIDIENFSTAEIGKNKTALIKTFSSAGNGSDSKSITVDLIKASGISNLCSIDLDYSNEAWVDKESGSKDEDCPIISYESKYKILRNDSEWYNIIVTKNTNTYSKDCKIKKQKPTEEIIYYYHDNKYIEKKM